MQDVTKNTRRTLRCSTVLLPLLVAAGSALLVANSFAMPADAQRPENSESARIGRQVAQQHCARCHAIGRRGPSPNAKAPRFPLIAERFAGNNPAPVLIDGTVVRHPGMPEFSLLEHETDGLVAYIRRISRNYKPPN
jgi:mono/diheme cytochrome c family protein